MTSDQIKKLRQYYHSLRGQQAIFDGLKGRTDQHPVRILEAEIRRLLIDFPDIVPAFNAQDFYSHTHDNHTFYYDVEGIRAFLAAALGRLQISIEVPSTTPVTEQKTFAFIREKAIRAIIERDYAEAQRVYISECWKSVIILMWGDDRSRLDGLTDTE